MTLVRWNPWREMIGLHNQINHLFGEVASPSGSTDTEAVGWNPVVDVYEKDDSVVIQAELPGVNKDDISIDLKDRLLTLRGERCSEETAKHESYHRRERFFGRFYRAFRLQANLDAERIQADYKDGVLTIEIPKAEGSRPRQITIH